MVNKQIALKALNLEFSERIPHWEDISKFRFIQTSKFLIKLTH